MERRQNDPIRVIQEDVARLRSEGVELIDWSMGAPEKPAPPQFAQAMKSTFDERARHNPSGYTQAQGHPPFLRKVEAFEGAVNHWPETHGNVLITNGASGAISAFLRGLPEKGTVLTFAPYFPLYRRFAEGAGMALAAVPFAENEEEQLSFLSEEMHDGIAAVIYNEPNNPSGMMRSRGFLEELGRQTHGIPVLSDEAYRGIHLGATPEVSVLEALCNPMSASAYSVSKTAGLAGERIGWLALHPDYPHRSELMDAIRHAMPAIGYIQAQTRAQVALAACDLPLMADWSENIDAMRTAYAGLCEAGYDVIQPQGGLYLAIRAPGGDSEALAHRLMHPGGRKVPVVTIPCGPFGLPSHVRASFVGNDAARVDEALETFRHT